MIQSTHPTLSEIRERMLWKLDLIWSFLMWILRNFDSPSSRPLLPWNFRTSENKKFSLYSLCEPNHLRSTVFELRERMFWSFVLILVFSYVDFMKSNSEIYKKDTECSHRVQSIGPSAQLLLKPENGAFEVYSILVSFWSLLTWISRLPPPPPIEKFDGWRSTTQNLSA